MNFKDFSNYCSNTRALIIGDIMLDRYVIGDVNRISPEAPVPVFLSQSSKHVLGGAGNVYNNLIPEDITNSMIVAGTGTIEIDGSVGPVGGIKQKIIAAKRAGAELILVPVANFEEAKPFEDDKTAIVAVDSFDEALSVISQYSSR